jgi:hypothetical protein
MSLDQIILRVLLAVGLCVAVLMLISCTGQSDPADDRLTVSEARALIHEDAERTWCREEIAGEPMLKPDWHEALGCR